jgi:hypothetical protein
MGPEDTKRLTTRAEKQIGKKQWKKMSATQRSSTVTALFEAELLSGAQFIAWR